MNTPAQTRDVSAGAPTLLGIPLDSNSSYLRGAAGAPPLIREALHCDSSNLWTEGGMDLGASGVLADAGDLKFTSEASAFAEIEAAVGDLLAKRRRPICLGGDHSVTYPIVKAFAGMFRDLTIVHFDAHPDLYHDFQGNRHSHASPFARIMEEKLVRRLIQVGIRTMNGRQKEQAEKFAVEVVEMRQLPAFEKVRAQAPVYISFDMDVLDPAFVPGISHREPGGMTVREAIAHLHAIRGAVVGADIVEYNPARDISQQTAMVCAKILKEIASNMLAA